MGDIKTLIIEAANRRDLTYAQNFNGRAYALMDVDWIGYFDTLEEVLEFLGFSVKTNTHIVIKREDIFKYLTDNQIKHIDDALNIIVDGRKRDGKKTDNSYYICNTDEPYADEVLEVILKAESER